MDIKGIDWANIIFKYDHTDGAKVKYTYNNVQQALNYIPVQKAMDILTYELILILGILSLSLTWLTIIMVLRTVIL